MMYVFYRNLCSLLLCCTCLGSVCLAHAAPVTGMEGGQRHSYGPGIENEKEKRIMSGGIIDAYGNPVYPTEEESVSRERLRPGAYGGARESGLSRPLPDVPGDDAGWDF